MSVSFLGSVLGIQCEFLLQPHVTVWSNIGQYILALQKNEPWEDVDLDKQAQYVDCCLHYSVMCMCRPITVLLFGTSSNRHSDVMGCDSVRNHHTYCTVYDIMPLW